MATESSRIPVSWHDLANRGIIVLSGVAGLLFNKTNLFHTILIAAIQEKLKAMLTQVHRGESAPRVTG